MEIKKDCYAYDVNNNKCRALRDLYCKKEQCTFYKSNKELSWARIQRELKNQ